MAARQSKPQAGRQMFLEQRAKLKASLATTRTNDTAKRFNRLDETQKKVVFILANAASTLFHGMPKLTRNLLDVSFENLSEQEQRSLMLGIKRLAELADAMPWEFLDYAAPHHEIQALRDKTAMSESTIN